MHAQCALHTHLQVNCWKLHSVHSTTPACTCSCKHAHLQGNDRACSCRGVCWNAKCALQSPLQVKCRKMHSAHSTTPACTCSCKHAHLQGSDRACSCRGVCWNANCALHSPLQVNFRKMHSAHSTTPACTCRGDAAASTLTCRGVIVLALAGECAGMQSVHCTLPCK